jgi:hypothetical protein
MRREHATSLNTDGTSGAGNFYVLSFFDEEKDPNTII